MSRKRNDKLRRLVQRVRARGDVASEAPRMFPTWGKNTQRKISSLRDLFDHGRRRV